MVGATEVVVEFDGTGVVVERAAVVRVTNGRLVGAFASDGLVVGLRGTLGVVFGSVANVG